MNSKILSKAISLAITALCGIGCQNLKPADIYPQMPPSSSFERKITTVWGQTEVIYRTGPEAKQP